ncbi:MAG TPA: nucleoside recognition domain-containing protein [Syntrophomonas sp.]|nr:nucleoside recognition domain-containing protein [Syntrophomonas sp.]
MKTKLFLYTIIILLSAGFMIINPHETVQAASQGVLLWSTIVLPALLPFFIVAELLVKIRFIHFMGVLMEPVMRPLFRLPGCSSLVMVMGFTSGFPVGAVLTRELYDQQQLTAEEAERLLVFTNNASPLYILGAVGIGMMGSPAAGYLLAFSAYLSNFLLGILLRFKATSTVPTPGSANRLEAAWQAMLPAPGSSPGIASMLGDAIRRSLSNVMAVGGFIVVFSVLTRILSQWGVIDSLAGMLFHFLKLFNFDYAQVYGLCMGMFEMTLGSKTATASATGSSLTLFITLSVIIAFSGISVIAQVMSIMAGTPVRLSFYLISRLGQMVITCILTFLAFKVALLSGIAVVATQSIPFYKVLYAFDAWTWALRSMLVALLIIFALLVIGSFKKT